MTETTMQSGSVESSELLVLEGAWRVTKRAPDHPYVLKHVSIAASVVGRQSPLGELLVLCAQGNVDRPHPTTESTGGTEPTVVRKLGKFQSRWWPAEVLGKSADRAEEFFVCVQPPLPVVTPLMVRVSHYLQILYSIVKSVAVQMMNVLISPQLATQMLFHYNSVGTATTMMAWAPLPSISLWHKPNYSITDSLAATARLIGLELTLRRAQ